MSFISVSRECGGSIILLVKLDRPRVIGDVGVNEEEKREEKEREREVRTYRLWHGCNAVFGLEVTVSVYLIPYKYISYIVTLVYPK